MLIGLHMFESNQRIAFNTDEIRVFSEFADHTLIEMKNYQLYKVKENYDAITKLHPAGHIEIAGS